MSKLLVQTVEEIATDFQKIGGKVLIIGGAVRDEMLEFIPKDYDLEVFGLSPAVIEAELRKKYTVDIVGKSFGVYKLHGLNIDISLPRKDSKSGEGHKDFIIEMDPYMSVADAALRRDFTINSMSKDPLTGDIHDFHGGVEDLSARRLRCTSVQHFPDDALRVLRGMQFAARFGLTATTDTIEACRSMRQDHLPPERLYEEWCKLILKGRNIGMGLEFLRSTGWLERYYPELSALVGCQQDPAWHPEGDVWEHTKLCLREFVINRPIGNSPDDENLIVGFSTLLHDVGKPSTTKMQDGRLRSHGHDEAGVPIAIQFMDRICRDNNQMKSQIGLLVKEHMNPYQLYPDASKTAIKRLASRVGRIDLLTKLLINDIGGRPVEVIKPEDYIYAQFLEKKATELEVIDARPKAILNGKILIDRFQLKEGKELGDILRAAYEAQLDEKINSIDDGIEWVRQYLV